jgi:hypothetical protein
MPFTIKIPTHSISPSMLLSYELMHLAFSAPKRAASAPTPSSKAELLGTRGPRGLRQVLQEYFAPSEVRDSTDAVAPSQGS